VSARTRRRNTMRSADEVWIMTADIQQAGRSAPTKTLRVSEKRGRDINRGSRRCQRGGTGRSYKAAAWGGREEEERYKGWDSRRPIAEQEERKWPNREAHTNRKNKKGYRKKKEGSLKSRKNTEGGGGTTSFDVQTM